MDACDGLWAAVSTVAACGLGALAGMVAGYLLYGGGPR